MINVAVLGYGTVGSGVVEVLEENNAQVSSRAGERICVKYILDLRDFRGDPYEAKIVHDFNVILQDEEIDIICEVMGGTGAAYQFTKQSLESGRSVCTSNKELVAKHGAELLELAARHSCNYMFEASVGGGIPVIRPMNNALTAEKILAVTGILNGTTNYILTKMDREGAEYDDALKHAQELGYAERNPEADVEGYDACRKLAILSSLMTGKNVDSEKIYTEGISGITSADFSFARAAGMSIKLLALGQSREDGSVTAIVAPFLVPEEHPLAMVKDVFNGILITGNMLGDAMFYGRGAGKLPTASAVAADVVDCARHKGKTVSCVWSREEAGLADISETERAFFVRVKECARREAEAVFQGGRSFSAAGCGSEFGILTPVMKESQFREKYDFLGDSVLGRIRLLG